MIERMPIHIDKRLVNLETIDDEIASENKSGALWSIINDHREPGTWFRVRSTIGWDEKSLLKAYNALYMRIYTRGMKSMLSVKASKVDGICFQWKIIELEDEIEMIEMHRRRLDKKLKWNKDRIQRLNEQKRENESNELSEQPTEQATDKGEL